MSKNSFIIHNDFYNQIEHLPDEIIGKLFRCIFDYRTKKIEPDKTDLLIYTLFMSLKSQFDRDEKKYEEVCNRNKVNGLNGGRPKKTELVSEKPKKPSGLSGFSEKPKKPDNDNDNDNEQCIMISDNEELFPKENNSNKRITKVILCPESDPDEKINYNELIDFVNSFFSGKYGTLRSPLSDKRKKMIACRIRDHGKEEFAKAIKRASESKYLNEQTWFSFDWMIKPTNYEKIISGNYDNKKIERSIANDTELAAAVARGIARGRANKAEQTRQ